MEILAAGRKSMCFTFADVGLKSIKLSEISIKGYQESAYWQKKYRCPQIILKQLGVSGATECSYEWKDEFDNDNEDAWDGGHWVDDKGKIVAGADDVTIGAGDGFFVDAALAPTEGTGCTAYTLMVNGEVLHGDYAAEVLAAGRKVMGNMMPAATVLSMIEIQGYQDSVYWQKKYRCPQIILKKLGTSGATESSYEWKDEFDNENEDAWDGGHWVDGKGKTIAGEDDITIGAGEAYFVDAALAPTEGTGCTAYTLVFPKCIN